MLDLGKPAKLAAATNQDLAACKRSARQDTAQSDIYPAGTFCTHDQQERSELFEMYKSVYTYKLNTLLMSYRVSRSSETAGVRDQWRQCKAGI